METFAKPRQLVENPKYKEERASALKKIPWEDIDSPIREVVEGFLKLECCFTLQACFGHFVYSKQAELDNLAILPAHDIGTVTYRIAYIAFCLEDSVQGRSLLSQLAEVPLIDSDYVQFGSPGWFWDQHLNSFALQVEPVRFKNQDQVTIDYTEALQVQKIRDLFFSRLKHIIHSFNVKG